MAHQNGKYNAVKASGLFAAVHNQEVSDGWVEYTDTEQKDSVGALGRVVDMLKEEMKAARMPNVFDDLFGFTVRRTKYCHKCGAEEAKQPPPTLNPRHFPSFFTQSWIGGHRTAD